MANFRALQPARMDEETSPPPPIPQSRPLLVQKPKRTVTLGACVACRKRKSKCDGNRPICTCCTQKDTECVYELGPNEKPSQAMKRKNEEMQGELSNLRQLYDYLRFRPEQDAIKILQQIRTNPANLPSSQRIQELADITRNSDNTTENPLHPPSPYQQSPAKLVTLPSIRLALESQGDHDSSFLQFPGMYSMGVDGRATQRPRYASDVDVSARSDSQGSHPRPTSIEAILHPPANDSTDDFRADPRLASIQDWTTVAGNTRLFVSIVSSWITHEYCYYHYLDLEAFLEDMASGRANFCSELLVNALLASASSTTSLVKERSNPFSERSIMTAFFKEATRLWDLEPGERSLTKIQAGICLYLFLGKHGRDKAGHVFLVEACKIAQDLGLFDSRSSHTLDKPSSAPQTKWESVRAVTAWALFNFQLNMSFTYCFPAIIKTLPSVSIPYKDTLGAEGKFHGHFYATFIGDSPLTTTALFRSECAKHIIILDYLNSIQNNNEPSTEDQSPPNPDKVETCYLHLTSWWQSRPPSLYPDQASSQEILLCAMMYYVNVINLFQPFFSLPSSSALYLVRARSVTSTALFELRRLLALQELRHGWSSTITLVLHPLSVTSFGSLDEISQVYHDHTEAESSEPYQGLLVCLRALAELCSYSYYAQPLFRLLTQKCTSMGLSLPIEVQTTLDYYTSEEWTRKAANLVSSQYIADTGKSVTDAESKRMDAIIETWGGLSIDDYGSGESTRAPGRFRKGQA